MSGSNIIGLVPRKEEKPEPVESLIGFLEDLLEKARAGELRGMSGACRFDDEATYFVMGYAGGFEMIGAMQTAIYSITGLLDDDE